MRKQDEETLGELGFGGNGLAPEVIIMPPKRLKSRIRVLERSVARAGSSRS